MYQHYFVTKRTILLYTKKNNKNHYAIHAYIYECSYQYMGGIQEALKPNGICKAQLVQKNTFGTSSMTSWISFI